MSEYMLWLLLWLYGLFCFFLGLGVSELAHHFFHRANKPIRSTETTYVALSDEIEEVDEDVAYRLLRDAGILDS